MNVNEALKLAGDYAGSLTTADDITNRDTMAVAVALDSAYESREWVAEWLEQKPAPKTGRAQSRFQADSRNRFAQWLAWRLEQDGRHALHGVHTYRLLDGVKIARQIDPTLNLTQGKIQSERNVAAVHLGRVASGDVHGNGPHVRDAALVVAQEPLERAHESIRLKYVTERGSRWVGYGAATFLEAVGR